MNIQHDEKGERFFIDLGGDEAYISYEKINDTTLDLQHTIVPEEHEGKGVATKLADHVFAHAKKNGLKLIPSCAFVSAYVERNPEVSELVVEDD